MVPRTLAAAAVVLIALVLATTGDARDDAPPAGSAEGSQTESPVEALPDPDEVVPDGAAVDPAMPPVPLDADEEVPLDWDVGPVSAAARRMLDRIRPSVVRIRGFYGANRAEAFHGTAFAVAPEGILLTNYHVIARAALAPAAYRLEYHTDDGEVGTVTILAVDVAHDLALVRANDHAPPPVELRTLNPAQGDRLYTIGYPLNLGLVITEGIGNGRIGNDFNPRLHYAGSLNPGMSGGPALDSRGRVVGINVSFSTRGQLVGFLIPAEFVPPLLSRAAEPLGPGSLRTEVARQLASHQAALLSAVPARFPTQVAAGYALPAELAPFVDCSAIASPPPVDDVLLQRVSCKANVGLSVEPGLVTGDFQFAHAVLVSNGLSDLQFATQLQRVATGAVPTPGSAQHVRGYSCRDSTVNLQRFQAAVTLCARRYRRYEEIFDIAMVVVSRNQPQRGFVSSLTLRGVDFAAGMTFAERYLEAMRWTR